MKSHKQKTMEKVGRFVVMNEDNVWLALTADDATVEDAIREAQENVKYMNGVNPKSKLYIYKTEDFWVYDPSHKIFVVK